MVAAIVRAAAATGLYVGAGRETGRAPSLRIRASPPTAGRIPVARARPGGHGADRRAGSSVAPSASGHRRVRS